MTDKILRQDEIKRKLRKLKKHETRIRFQSMSSQKNLVWDDFFELRERETSKAKYTLKLLAALKPEQYTHVIHEYLSAVYDRMFEENGIFVEGGLYDPSLLSKLGLPSNADEGSVKRRFRELVKQYHPDAGGNAEMFIELMNNYREILGKHKR